MTTQDPIVDLLVDEPGDQPDFGFRQGLVVAWNGFTGENTIRIGGTDLTDLPILDNVEIFGVRAGDTVAVIKYQNTYFVIGRIFDPGDVTQLRSVAIMRDFKNNLIFAPDLVNAGFARPYLPVPMHVLAFANAINTVSATFENIFGGIWPRQNPRIKCEFTAITPVGTTGEARLMVGGVQHGAVITIASGAFANFTIGPVVVTGSFLQQFDVALQGRRTGGAGNVGFWMRGVVAEAS